MKRITLLLSALAALLFFSCDSAPKQEGKPFDELPALEKSDILAFFKAIPAADLPDMIKSVDAREKYFKNFVFMQSDGALGDGDGLYYRPSTDNVVFWSDYLEGLAGTELEEENENTPHPYANIYVYAGAESGKTFGVLKAGAYVCGDEKVNPDKYYWFDSKSGKMTSVELPLKPAYTEDDLTADPLIVYGAENLYYAIKNGVYQNYYDRGMEVYIEEVGRTGVVYEWNGVEFVRDSSKPVPCIENWAFANFYLGGKLPWDIPGYSTTFISSTEYESTYHLVKSGETEPTLIFVTNPDEDLVIIEVCSSAYSNPYGIYPGMPYSDFIRRVNEIGEQFPEPPYVSFNDSDEDFVTIYTGMDEDFFYMVSKSEYLGDEKFSDNARIARVCVMNAVG